MSSMKSSNEFAVGKHNIGWITSDFKKYFDDIEFDVRAMPTFQKLGKTMKDAQIESELKPGFSELGDVVAFMDSAPEECKDGYANLFYFPSCVVDVSWVSFGRGWDVHSWGRGDSAWDAGERVFSPATGRSVPCAHHCCSCALAFELSELQEWKKKVDKVLRIEE